MKKKKIIALTALAAVASVAASCGTKSEPSESSVTPSSESSTEVTIVGLEVSGGTREYGIGDKVSTSGVTVLVKYSDGSKKDMTSSATFDTSAVDTSKAGNYSVSVKCAGQSSSYSVIVKDDVFDSIEFEEGSYSTSCAPFATLDLSSVKVDAVYKNAVSGVSRKVEVANKDVTFVITNAKGEEVSGQIEEVGNYTVTATYNEKSVSYTVVCAAAPKEESVSGAVTSAVKNENTINCGSYAHKASDYSETRDYTIGQNFVKVTESNSYSDSGYRNIYYSLTSNGKIFAAQTDANKDGSDVEDTLAKFSYNQDYHAANVKDASAVGFDMLQSGSDEYPEYGFGNSIAALYAQYESSIDPTKSESKGALTNIKDSEGNAKEGYKFSFNYVYAKYGKSFGFRTYSVEFTLNDSGALDNAYISLKEYKSENDPYVEFTDGATIPSDLGLTLVTGTDAAGATVYSFTVNTENKDESGNDISVVKPSEDIYTVSQTSGLKASDDTNPYMAKNVTIDSFKINQIEGETTTEIEDDASFEIDLDNATVLTDDGYHRFEIQLGVSDITPETANSTLDSIKANVVGTTIEGYAVDYSNWKGMGYASIDSNYKLRISHAGTYTVTFSAYGVTKSITYVVSQEAPSEIDASLYDGESGDFASVDSFDAYTTNTVYIKAEVNSQYDQAFSAIVKKYNEESKEYEDVDLTKVTFVKDTYTINGKEVSCYALSATEAGKYLVTVYGAKPDNTTKTQAFTTIVVNVSEAPSAKDIVKGDYEYSYEANVSANEIYKVKFSVSETNENEGTVTISKKHDETKKQVASYTYENGVFTVVTDTNTLGLDSDAEFDIKVSAYYKLKIVNSATEASYNLTKPTSDILDADWAALKGKYEGTLSEKTYSFKFAQGNEKGEGSFELTVDSSSYSYTYKYDDATGKLVSTMSGEGSDPLSGLTLSVSDAKITLSDSTNSVELEVKSINLSEVLAGKFTLESSNGGSYTIVFNVNDNASGTIDITRGSKSGVYSFKFNADTNVFTIEKTSGKNCYVSGFELDGDDLYFIYNGKKEKCDHEGGSSTPTVVEIPSAYVGTWTGKDSWEDTYSVVIASNTITVSGYSGSGTYTVESVKDNVVTAGKVTLTLGTGSISYSYSNGYVTCTLTPYVPTVPDSVHGTYEGTNPVTEENETVEIAETSVIYGGYTYNIVSADNGTYVFDDGTGFKVSFVVASDGTITFTNESSASFTLHTPSTPSVVEFSDNYVGFWHDNTTSYSVIVTTNSVSFNGTEGTNLSYSEDDDMYSFDITVDDTTTSYYLYFYPATSTKLTIRKVMDTLSAVDLENCTVSALTGEFTYNDGSDDISVVIGDSTVQVGDYTYNIDSTLSTATYILAKDSDDPDQYQIKITLVNGVAQISDTSNAWSSTNGTYVMYAVKSTDGGDSTITSLTGTFEFNDNDDYTLVISGNTITVTSEYDELSYEIKTSSDNQIVAEDPSDSAYSIRLTLVDGKAYYESGVDGSYNEKIEMTRPSSSAPTVTTFSEDYIGTWFDIEKGTYIVINEDSIRWNEEDATFEYDSENVWYTVTVDSKTHHIYMSGAYIETAMSDANGHYSFVSIVQSSPYDMTGTYTFTDTETSTDESGATVSTTVNYTVTVSTNTVSIISDKADAQAVVYNIHAMSMDNAYKYVNVDETDKQVDIALIGGKIYIATTKDNWQNCVIQKTELTKVTSSSDAE